MTRRGSALVESGLNRRGSRSSGILSPTTPLSHTSLAQEAIHVHSRHEECISRTRWISESTLYRIMLIALLSYTILIDDMRLLLGERHIDQGIDISILLTMCLLTMDVFIHSISRPVYLLSMRWFMDMYSTSVLPLECVTITSGLGGRFAGIFGDPRLFIALIQIGRGFRIIRLIDILHLIDHCIRYFNRFQRNWSKPRASPVPSLSMARTVLSPGSQARMSRFFVDDDSILANGVGKSIFFRKTMDMTEETLLEEVKMESRTDKKIRGKLRVKLGIVIVTAWVVSCLLFPPSYGEDWSDMTSVDYIFPANTVAAGYIQLVDFGNEFRPNYENAIVDFVGGTSEVVWIGISDGNEPPELTNIYIPPLSVFQQAQLESQWITSECYSASVWVSLTSSPACESDLREMELQPILSSPSTITFSFHISKRSEVITWAWKDLLQLVSIFFAILVGCISCELELHRLLISPLIQLAKTVHRLKSNPLCANNLLESKKRSSSGSVNPIANLELSLLDTGSLLVTSFGGAGAKIIANAISETGESLGSAGEIVSGVFAFIGIADFDILTEALGGRMVGLVNQVAEIVHGIVDEFGGFVAKNTGQGFSVVWKFENGLNEFEIEKTVELAVTCIASILAASRKSPILAQYRDHPKLVARSAFQIRLHSGIHLGKAIEGAIGSLDLKLDAVYLGRDTVVPERLHALAKDVYRTNVLVSSAIALAVTREFRTSLFRQIDSIDGGEGVVMDLFTVDLDVDQVGVGSDSKGVHSTTEDARKLKIKRQFEKLVSGTYSPLEAFTKHELGAMRQKHTTHHGHVFSELFNKGFLNYQCGEWEIAKHALEQTLVFWRNHPTREERIRIGEGSEPVDLDKLEDVPVSAFGIDGPSLAILKFINTCKHTNYTWKGYRHI
jgi:class 3 adenylate cyclase